MEVSQNLPEAAAVNNHPCLGEPGQVNSGEKTSLPCGGSALISVNFPAFPSSFERVHVRSCSIPGEGSSPLILVSSISSSA